MSAPRSHRPRRLLGLVLLVLLLAFTGGEAEAQYFGDRPTGATRKSREGRRLGLSLRLLYQVPQFESRVSIDARQDLLQHELTKLEKRPVP